MFLALIGIVCFILATFGGWWIGCLQRAPQRPAAASSAQSPAKRQAGAKPAAADAELPSDVPKSANSLPPPSPRS